jgi:cysteine desulfurase
MNKRSAFKPLLIGGSQENNRRAGTENVAAIVALGKAAECAGAALAEENCRVRKMRDRFETGILERVPNTLLNGDPVARLPNTSNLSFSGIEADAALVMFDRHRLCCSAGSACRTGSLESSHVLRAMNVPPERARASMRFSFGRFNTEADIDKALEIIPAVISKLRALSPGNTVREPATV